MSIIGADLSQWNAASNFATAKTNGLKFVILRAGSGLTYVDAKFESSYKNAKAAGVPVGAYWYLYAMNIAQAEKEADLFIARLKGKTFEYPVWLDFEDPTQNKLSRTVKTQMALAFMNKVEKAGYFVGLYSMGSWLRNSFDRNLKYGGKCIADYDEWTAHWTHNPSKKGSTVPSWAGIWQYTDVGSFTGLGKAGGSGLDLNVSYKDYPGIMKSVGLNGFAKDKPVAPPVEEKPVQVIPNTDKYVTYNNTVDKASAERLHALLGLKMVDLNAPNNLKESDYVVHVGGGVNKFPDIVLKGGDRMDTDTKVTRFIESNK